MESIMVQKETKDRFEQERFKLRMKQKRNIFQDEFINILLDREGVQNAKTNDD